MPEPRSPARDIAYGRADPANPGPSVRVGAGVPLRLCDGIYPFDEAPDLVRLTTVAERMLLLLEHLQSLCPPWDRNARRFLEAYFAAVAAEVAKGDAELAALAQASGLFTPADWSFAALRPLPQAHLGGGARAEIAFWTGARIVAIGFEGEAGRAAREAAQRIAEAGAELVRLPAAALGSGRLDLAILPPEFRRFWSGVTLPSSPFGPIGL